MLDAMLSAVRTDDKPKTTLLMHFNGTDGQRTTVDETGKTCTFVGNASVLKLSTAFPRFGTAGVRFNGGLAVAHLLVNSTAVLPTGLEDFTIEFFIRWESFRPGGSVQIVTCGAFEIRSNPGATAIVVTDSAGLNYTASLAVSNKAQRHCALVRRSGTLFFYVDGVLASSVSYNKAIPANTLKIHNSPFANADYPFDVSIDELRISNVARYSANFTTPTAAFTLD